MRIEEDKSIEVRRESLRTRATKTAGWTIVGYGLSMLIRLASSVVMTRLLAPELFALMGLAQVFVNGLQMLTDVGIQVGVIQSDRNDPTYLDTAWTLQIIRACILFLLSLAAAWPFAAFYEQPSLLWVLPVCCLGIAINGWKSTSTLTAIRDMRQGRLIILSQGARALSLIIMVLWAIVRPSIGALLAGGIANSLLFVSLSHAVLGGHRHRIRFDRSVARDFSRIGRWIVISTALTFLANQCDRLILGKLLDIQTLGVLMISYTLYMIPREVVMTLSSNVIFPAMRHKAQMPRAEFRATILRSRGPLLALLAVGVAAIASSADWVVELLYDKRYHQGGWMLSVLMLGLWPRILDATICLSLVSIEKLQYNPIGSGLRLILIASLMPVAYSIWGLPGAVIVVALGDLPNYLASLVGLIRNGLAGLRQDSLATLLFVVLFGAAIAIRNFFGLGSPLGSMA